MRILNWRKWWQKWANFTEKQKEAERLVDFYDYLFYGGAGGGGKSYFLRKYPIKFLIENCWHRLKLKGVRVGIFCEDYPALWDRHICRIPYEFPNWLGEYRSMSHEFAVSPEYGGGVICFRNLDDPSKYASADFALIEVDELTKNPRETFHFIRMRKRWAGIQRTKFVGASNPGGIGHGWVQDLWMRRKFDPNEQEASQFFFLPAKATDNPHLDASYLKTLDSLPEKLRKAYRDGNWDIFAGQYFTEWDSSIHTCHPFPIPAGWKKFRSYDHGYENPACCKWYALDYEGRVYVYRELYVRGYTIDKISEEILRLSGDENYEWSVCDSSIFAQTGIIDRKGGSTIAEAFARRGLLFIPSSKRRIDGWNLMHQYLYWDEVKKPKLIHFNTCYNSVRTLPALIHDDKNPEDVNTRCEDHPEDCDRYFLMALHETRTPKPLTDIEKKLQLRREGPVLDFNTFYRGEIV